MYSKGVSFVIVLIALALAGGAVAVSQLTTNNQPAQLRENEVQSGKQPTTEVADSTGASTELSRTSSLQAAVVSARDKVTLADIERELGYAEKSGGISPTAYRTLDTKLKALEVKGVDTKTARAILGKLSVGGKSPVSRTKSSVHPSARTSPQQGSKLAVLEREITVLAGDARPIGPEHYARLKATLDAETRAGANQTTTRKLLMMLEKVNPDNITSTQPSSPASAPREDCAASTAPVLTADITDFSKIQKITAPGTASLEGPKGHSFIWTNGALVPIYAPVAGIYDSGSYSKDNAGSKAQYLMFFRVKGSCGYQFKFDHVDEPIAAIRVQLPSVPKVADSRGTPATTPVEFKAGDLVGYTSGNVPSGNWDFGLYNTKKEGKLAAQGSYGIHRNSVCWVDFYTANKRAAYRRLLEGPELVCSLSAPNDADDSVGDAVVSQTAQPVAKTGGDSEPPLKLKSIGILLGDFDAATGKAGDVVFTKEKLQFNVPFTEFGFVIPASQSASGANKSNPQPTFELPMGTKVRALVDGVVAEMPKLYSGDYSIMVAPSQNSNWRYETEHVINPLVRVGDKVTAGQVIAEVSPHNSAGNSGFGLVEIGILKGGNPPKHLCPFAYLDPSIKDGIQKKLLAFYRSWEAYRGDATLYNEAAQAAVPGCLTLEPIEG